MVDSLSSPDSHNSASPVRLSEDTDLQTLLNAILGESLAENDRSQSAAPDNVVSLTSHRATDSERQTSSLRAPEASDDEASAGDDSSSVSRAPVPFVARNRKRDTRPTTQNGVLRPVGNSGVASAPLRGVDASATGASSGASLRSLPSAAAHPTSSASARATDLLRHDSVFSNAGAVSTVPSFWRRPLVIGVTLAAIVTVVWVGSRSTSPSTTGSSSSTIVSTPVSHTATTPSGAASGAPAGTSDSTVGVPPASGGDLNSAHTAQNTPSAGAGAASAASTPGRAETARTTQQSESATRVGSRATRPAPARRATRRSVPTRRRTPSGPAVTTAPTSAPDAGATSGSAPASGPAATTTP